MNTLFLQSSEGFDELPAKSSIPWVWFGYFFAFAFLVGESLSVGLDLEPTSFDLVLVLIALSGWIYWLVCVFRFHTILREISRNHYAITGAEAVGRHFIPFYNMIWIFKWPAAFSDYINARGRVKMVSGNLLGVLFMAGALLRFVDAAIGLTVIFSVGMYMSAKLRRHIAEIKALSPEMLPPLPDASMFRAASISNEQSQAQVHAPATEPRRDSFPDGSIQG